MFFTNFYNIIGSIRHYVPLWLLEVHTFRQQKLFNIDLLEVIIALMKLRILEQNIAYAMLRYKIGIQYNCIYEMVHFMGRVGFMQLQS